MKKLLLFLSFLTITISMANGIGWAETLSTDQNQTTDPILGRELINIPGSEANPDTQQVRVLVKMEPGDGLARLSWQTAG